MVKEQIIVLDPGHGGLDSGAVSQGYFEKHFNWKIAYGIKRQLVQHYCNVVIVQPSESFSSTARDEMVVPPMVAKYLKADYYLSIHQNAGGGRGFESYVRKFEVGTESDRKRGIIHDEIMAGLSQYGVVDRGKKYEDFLVLVLSDDKTCDSCLLEYLFIDSTDIELLKNNNFIDNVSNWTAYGLVRALNIPLRSEVRWTTE